MFRHNLLLIYRTFQRFKTTFFINLIGLSTGLACALLIYLWVNDELHVDKFHEKDDRLFQVMKNLPTASGILTLENTQGRLAEALAEEIPEIEYAVSVIPSARWFSSKGTLSTDDTRVRADGYFVGKDYFNVFSINFIQGDKERLSSDKNNIAISETLAVKLFNTTTNVIGKVVEWDQEILKGHYVIAGIFEEPPPSSTAKFDILFNYELFIEKNPKLENWSNSDPNTYVIVRKGADIGELEGKIADFIKSKNPNSKETLFLQQYSRKYLYNHYENGVQAGGRIEYVKLFSIIAIFLLVIACINFMNLSTAKASRRIKEIGIRKAVGADRKSLVFQFLGESILMAFLSLAFAIVLVALSLPTFNQITGKYIDLNFNSHLILPVLSLTLITGLISGSYPALYLSGFRPAIVLKGKINTSTGESWVRKGLVVFQFAISVILIGSVWVVYKQIEFIHTKNLGYNKDNILYFEKGEKDDPQGNRAFENELEGFLLAVKNIPGVLNASNFRHSILNRQGGTSAVSWPEKEPDTHIDFTDLPVGYDFIETLGIEIKEGRSFSRAFGAQKSTVIFNEEAIQRMGLKEPIGKTVKIWGEDREIIGVAENFHFQSFYENIKPLFFDLSLAPRVSKIIVKISAGSEKETIERLQELYSEYNPGLPFEYTFLDRDYQLLYASENRAALLSQYFAAMAILISCLGLFGLALFTAERRIKEISIRKILGASEFGIIRLLSADFTRMVIMAIVIALPISYFIAKSWLEGFAYRIDLEWWFFIGAGLMALLIAWFTIGLQTVKAARVNPTECLKDE